MTRRYCMCALLALAACGEKAQLPPDLFAATAPGGWKIVEMRDLTPGDAPDPVPRNSIEGIRTASYKGEGDLEARVYLLTSAEVGAALGGRWRPSADTVFFNHDRYFVVVKWQSAGRVAVQEFVADLQKRLGAARRPKES